MKKLTLIALLLAAAWGNPAAAADSISGYYVVVPLKGRVGDAPRINVSLSDYTLPRALLGIPYEGFDFRKLLSVTGDAGYTGYGVKWSVAEGSLPAGMSLSSTGKLTGTPTAEGTATFHIRATYKTKNGDTAYQVFVGKIVVTLGAGTPPQAIVGQAYSYDLKKLLTVTGDNAYNGSGVTWSVVSSSLPTGLALRADGTISGTPSASGTGTVTARATYRNAKGEQTYQVVTLAIDVTLAAGSPQQAIVGQAYSYDLKPLLQVTGDNAYNGSGITWSVVSSTLPAGLQLKADGTIGGTPNASGTGTITARATYRGVNGEQTYQIVTLAINVSLAAATPPEAIVGQAYSYDLKNLLTVTGDNAYNGTGVTWTVVSNTLPAGLQLKADGTIAGMPTAAGTGSVTARATYRGVNGQQAYQVVTLGINVTLAAGSPPQAIVGQAYSYDLKNQLTVTGDNAYNGSGVTWSVVSSTLPAGLSLRADGTIAGTPTAGGTGNITARATYRGVNGDQTYQVVSLNIKVTLAAGEPPQGIVGQAYTYDLKNLLTVTGDNAYNGSGVTWTVVANSLPAGLQLNADGTIGGTPTAAGSGTVTARATYRNVNGEQTYQVVTLSVSVTLAAGTPPQAIVGQAYSYDLKSRLTVTGDSAYNGSGVTWTVVSGTLPAGLSLRADGTIAGTPTAAGTGTLTARATYRGVNGDQAYQVVSLNINVSLAAGSPPQGIVGQAYNYDLKNLLTVTGDSAYNGSGVTWSVVSNTLPAGLQLSASGAITGTPTAAGSGSVTARATYRGVNGDQTYQVVTLNIKVSLAAGSPPQAIVGQAYSYDLKNLLTVSGDNAYTGSGVSWSVVSSSLAAGLTLRSDGTISGTPTASGTGTITARATYRGVNGEQAYQVVTLGITVALAAGSPPQGIVGQAYSYDLKPLLTVSGDPAYNGSGVTWSAVSNGLPAGLSLRSDGVIVGTPTAGGTGNLTARATYRGVNGDQMYQVVSLNIVVSLAASTPPQAIVGQAYSYALKPLLTVSGDGAYNGSGVTWTVVSSTLPAGLQLLSDGTISGTPTAGGSGAITARATYRNVNGQQTYQVVSLNITVSLASAALPQAQVGSAYSYDLKPLLTVSGDSAYNGSGITWSVVSNTLPSGLNLTTAGVIAGTPTASTTGSITARATYRNVNGQQSYSITAIPAYTYAWANSSWSIPAACGSTTETRSVWCLRSDGTTVADASCSGSKPATSAATTDYSACTYSWQATGWATPAACGSTTASRTVYCQRSDGTTVADSSCSATAKPATTTATTDYSTCSYTWQATGWSTPAACGSTTATRTVYCQRSDGTTVADSSCGGTKPATTTATTDYSTCSYTWQATGWSTPAACGSTTATRTVYCQRSDGTTVADSSCGGTKPATTTATTDYSSCSYSWNYSAWNTPSACGSTTATRSVWCQRSDGTTVADGSCSGTKPATTTGTTDYSSCTYSWSTSGWSVPSGCGYVTETRSATCYRSDGTAVSGSYCGTAPATSATTTNYSSCSYSFSYGSWSTPSGCGSVTATRSATCYRSDGTAVSSSYCGTPSTTMSTTDYSSCSYSWSYGAWSTPSGCGSVTATRSATCVRSDGTAVSSSYCGTPTTTTSTTDYSSCSYSWSYGSWGACSVSCGGGTQTRSATCVRSDGAAVSSGYCGTPVTSQSCNTQACGPTCQKIGADWVDTVRGGCYTSSTCTTAKMCR